MTTRQAMPFQRKIILSVWACFLLVFFSFFFFWPEIGLSIFHYFTNKGMVWTALLLLVLGCLRGFTLVPPTMLVLFGILLLPPGILFVVIMVGIVVSSLTIYYFFEYLDLESLFNQKYQKYIDKGKYYLEKYELPVIIFWSFALFLPVDIMCYLCGTLRVNVYKFVFGVFIGEGAIYAIYIFGANYLTSFIS